MESPVTLLRHFRFAEKRKRGREGRRGEKRGRRREGKERGRGKERAGESGKVPERYETAIMKVEVTRS